MTAPLSPRWDLKSAQPWPNFIPVNLPTKGVNRTFALCLKKAQAVVCHSGVCETWPLQFARGSRNCRDSVLGRLTSLINPHVGNQNTV